MVSIAGIGANMILAIIGFAILKTLIETGALNGVDTKSGIAMPLMLFVRYLLTLNISLAVFNLLPFPPLDGSKVLSTFLPENFGPIFALLEQYGFLILLLLVYWGVVGIIIQPVFYVVQYLLVTPWF
jgi:Zn-dependent protease